ncbi:MaoC family dehydratase [Methylobacterium fujisawaense]|uniref:MaoC family dehydratase n=1 Tax=Methylobacterium fujisawaense TaxID=107400 RepID=UPI002F356480
MNGSGSDEAAATTRTWTEAHQVAFARATGDVNPMHMDARMARRTLAGERAVHGVHAALWALDACADAQPLDRLATLQMRFERFVLVGDRTVLTVHEADARQLRLSVAVDGVRTLTIQATFAADRAPARPVEAAPTAIPAEPVARDPAALPRWRRASPAPSVPAGSRPWAASRPSSACSCPASTRSSRRST